MPKSQRRKPFREIVAEKLVKQLKRGTAPWQKPWGCGAASGFLPYNPVTNNRYRGINALHLASEDHSDQRWLTYKQATSIGAQVRRGEHGTSVQYWKITEERVKRDDLGKPVKDGDGNNVKEIVELERPRVFSATVFNAEQMDGILPVAKKALTWDPIERAEKLMQASGADVRHAPQDSAYYHPSTDRIHLPMKEQFDRADQYYATALHELGHWTGHGSRLKRDLSGSFGSSRYAKEELRAKIFSLIIGDQFAIGHDPGQHAAYVANWIQILQDNPSEIFWAAADAEKIQTFVLSLERSPRDSEARFPASQAA